MSITNGLGILREVNTYDVHAQATLSKIHRNKHFCDRMSERCKQGHLVIRKVFRKFVLQRKKHCLRFFLFCSPTPLQGLGSGIFCKHCRIFRKHRRKFRRLCKFFRCLNPECAAQAKYVCKACGFFLRLINNMTMCKQKYAIGLHFIKQCIFCSATTLSEYTLRPKEC